MAAETVVADLGRSVEQVSEAAGRAILAGLLKELQGLVRRAWSPHMAGFHVIESRKDRAAAQRLV